MLPSWQEMIPVLIILIIIFGARKLPEIGAGLGKGIKEFKKSMKEVEEPESEKKSIESTAEQDVKEKEEKEVKKED